MCINLDAFINDKENTCLAITRNPVLCIFYLTLLDRHSGEFGWVTGESLVPVKRRKLCLQFPVKGTGNMKGGNLTQESEDLRGSSASLTDCVVVIY